MKRLFVALLLVVGLVCAPIGAAFAESAINPASDYTVCKTYVFVKDAATHGGASTLGASSPNAKAVPVTTITTSSKIMGFSVIVNSATKGAIASLYDLPTVAASATGQTADDVAEQSMTNTYLFAEAETSAANGSVTVWFPYPKKITTQLGIMIGSAYATVVVYYIY